MADADLDTMRRKIDELSEWQEQSRQHLLTLATDLNTVVQKFKQTTDLLLDNHQEIKSVTNTNVLILSVVLRHGQFDRNSLLTDLKQIAEVPEVVANKHMLPQVKAFISAFEDLSAGSDELRKKTTGLLN